MNEAEYLKKWASVLGVIWKRSKGIVISPTEWLKAHFDAIEIAFGGNSSKSTEEITSSQENKK